LAVPWTVAQHGLGLGSVSAQSRADLAHRPIRDPRLGIAQVLCEREGAIRTALGTRYSLVIPLGDEEALAGNRGFAAAPALTFELEHARFFSGTELGARLRQPTRLANTRLGTQLVVGAGAGFDLAAPGRLAVAVEGWVAPTLIKQPPAPSGGHDTLVPAEWFISVRSTPLNAGPTVTVGGGGGMPLSTSGGNAAVGMTSPDFRMLVVVRQRLHL
jgi:hypothetical protein